MKVLFDVIHPADALFFHNPILELKRRGDTVAIASRERDVTTALLDRLGHRHEPLTAASDGAAHYLLELGRRDAAIWRVARSFRPDVMVGFGGICISHVGKLLSIPSISFYDTEIARAQLVITLPFISEWHVPDSYTGPVPNGRTHRFAGPSRLSYFHPRNFKADRSRALRAGLDPDRPNFLVRTVAWSSSHDFGKHGWTPDQLQALVDWLWARGRVHISAERNLPAALEPLRYRGDVLDLHHLLACCDAYVGESATMAAEAGILGVPAVYGIGDYRGYVDDLAEKGLVHRSDGTLDDILSHLEQVLGRDPECWRRLRDGAVSEWIDVSDYVVSAIDRHRPKLDGKGSA